jgi:hypothetical protein
VFRLSAEFTILRADAALAIDNGAQVEAVFAKVFPQPVGAAA